MGIYNSTPIYISKQNAKILTWDTTQQHITGIFTKIVLNGYNNKVDIAFFQQVNLDKLFFNNDLFKKILLNSTMYAITYDSNVIAIWSPNININNILTYNNSLIKNMKEEAYGCMICWNINKYTFKSCTYPSYQRKYDLSIRSTPWIKLRTNTDIKENIYCMSFHGNSKTDKILKYIINDMNTYCGKQKNVFLAGKINANKLQLPKPLYISENNEFTCFKKNIGLTKDHIITNCYVNNLVTSKYNKNKKFNSLLGNTKINRAQIHMDIIF